MSKVKNDPLPLGRSGQLCLCSPHFWPLRPKQRLPGLPSPSSEPRMTSVSCFADRPGPELTMGRGASALVSQDQPARTGLGQGCLPHKPGPGSCWPLTHCLHGPFACPPAPAGPAGRPGAQDPQTLLILSASPSVLPADFTPGPGESRAESFQGESLPPPPCPVACACTPAACASDGPTGEQVESGPTGQCWSLEPASQTPAPTWGLEALGPILPWAHG